MPPKRTHSESNSASKSKSKSNSPSNSKSKSSNSKSPDKKKQKKEIFENIEDINNWLINPLIHPITKNDIFIYSKDYSDLYNKAFNFLEINFKNNYNFSEISHQYLYINFISKFLPKNHVLFKKINNDISKKIDSEIINYGIDILLMNNINKIFKNYKFDIFYHDNVKNTDLFYYWIVNDSINENEYYLINNNNDIAYYEINFLKKLHTNDMLDYLKQIMDFYINNLIKYLLQINNYIDYDTNFKKFLTLFNDRDDREIGWKKSRETIFLEYINFIKNYYINITNNEESSIITINEYIIDLIDDPNLEHEEWMVELNELYEEFNTFLIDIKLLIEKNTEHVIDNLENKQFKIIDDPIDKYFQKYDNIFKHIKKEYSDLIDITTLNRIDNLYLTEEQFDTFIKQKEKLQQEFDNKKKMYSKKMIKYNKIKGIDNLSPEKSPEKSPDKSPKKSTEKSPEKSPEKPIPPMKPSITLPNGAIYNLGAMNPKFISKKRLDNFNIEYNKIEKDIIEYNKIKNLSYIDLINKDKSPSSKKSANDELYKDNKLLKQTREEIQSNILNNTTQDKNKCSENIDIITQEEFDDTYPLAKLQLIVQIKRTKDITDCYYAPDLYNSFVKSVNNKLPFQHPITKKTYNSDDINKLMEIMKIIDPNIEIPKFLKPINDINLKLVVEQKIFYNQINDNLSSQINFYRILITRKFGDTDYLIYNLCYIPSDIEHSDTDYQTHSTDLTSATMVHNIKTLFDNGLLLSNYVLPYYKLIQDNGREYKQIIKLGIHFNNYSNIDNWLFDKFANNKKRTKEEFIDMFKHYAQEVKSFI